MQISEEFNVFINDSEILASDDAAIISKSSSRNTHFQTDFLPNGQLAKKVTMTFLSKFFFLEIGSDVTYLLI